MLRCFIIGFIQIDGISLHAFNIFSILHFDVKNVSRFLLQANRLTDLSGISMLIELTELHISDQGIESLADLAYQVFY